MKIVRPPRNTTNGPLRSESAADQLHFEWILSKAEAEHNRRSRQRHPVLTLEWLALREVLFPQNGASRWDAANQYARLQALKERTNDQRKRTRAKRPRYAELDKAIESVLRIDIGLKATKVRERARALLATKESRMGDERTRRVEIDDSKVSRIRRRLKEDLAQKVRDEAEDQAEMK